MKRIRPISLLVSIGTSLVLAGGGPALAGTVGETPHEFQLAADLDGDGREDLVVIDKSSGGFRTAYQLAAGVWTWYGPRATGMDSLTGVAVGRWFDTGRDSFAVASPLANRVHTVQAPVPGGVPLLDPIFMTSIGPSQLAAPDIGGGGNTVHDDLWTGSRENSAPTPHRITTTRHTGAAFIEIANVSAGREVGPARDIVLKDGGQRHVVYLGRQGDQDDQLTILSYATGATVLVALEPVPQNSRWTSGNLLPGGLHHILAWQPGGTSFRAVEITENPPDVFGLNSIGDFDTGSPIGTLSIVASDAGPRLLVLDPDGSSAQVYSFDGINAPSLLQIIEAAPGEQLTGAVPSGPGGFQLLSGPAGASRSQAATRYEPNGGTFSESGSSTLPVLNAAAMRANAFAFAGEPFVDPEAELLAQYNAPDWTSEPVLQGGNLSVDKEILASPDQGLVAGGSVVLGTVPMGTTFALTNQYGEALSLHSYSANQGPTGATVEIQPVDGIMTRAILMTFNALPANAPVFYRLNEGQWIEWDLKAKLINEDTVVHYYARHPLTQQPSAIGVAHYLFEKGPFELDSDDDGVPDFVEENEGLDPLGGVDTDGDGYNDLNEILVGTDPNDFESKPSPAERLEENIAFRMRVAPLPVDGQSGNRVPPAEGARLDVFGLDGSSLAGGAAVDFVEPGVTTPGLTLDAVVADARQHLVSVMTEPVYAINTPGEDKDRGREIAGLYLIPEGSVPPVQYSPGNGTMQEETDAWIAAALAARDSIERQTVSGNWTEIDTLIGLLLEMKLESIYLDRGLPGLAAGQLSLFSGRIGDTGRFAPSGADLADLREQLSESLPGHDIGQLFNELSQAAGTDLAYAGLRDAATAIYQLSSEASNSADPGTYLPPFDVLRAFVRGTPLAEPYLSEVGLTQQQLDAAQALVGPLLDGLSPRPVDSFTLEVQEDSFSNPCHALLVLGTDTPVNLFAAPGQPYPNADGFQLIGGTKLFVTGYSDIEDADCPGQDLEVISVVVLEFPPVPATDENGNLLKDAWEEAFLMGEGDPFGDDDLDGIFNLQEMLDGTDPLDPLSKAEEAFDLSPPEILVTVDLAGITLQWEYPAEYAGNFDWLVEVSQDFVNWDPVVNPVVENPAGTFTVEIPASDAGIFRVGMSLK